MRPLNEQLAVDLLEAGKKVFLEMGKKISRWFL